MNQRDLEKAISGEVEHWHGVTVEFVTGGKHPKARFTFNGNMLSRPYPGSPSDGMFGVHRCLGDMRRVMKQLGATRDKPEPTMEEDEAPYRKPNNGAAERGNSTGEKATPKPDIIDQLVDAGLAKQDAADVARSEKVLSGERVAVQATGSVATYEKRAEADAQPVLASPVGVSDEPAGRLLRELVDRGFDLHMQMPFTRAEVIGTAVTMIEEGIYFGLPMEIYRNVPRLGAGSLSDLNKSAGDFWAGSWMDPDRKDEADEEEKKWKVVGTAYHCARLEPEQFEVRYWRKPCKADYADEAAKVGACWNGTDIGNQLGSMGTTKKAAGESVAQQGERLEANGYGGVIWPLIEARAEAGAGDRIGLDAKVWDEIVRDMDRLRGSSEIAELLGEGASEVSVFWTDENNIQRKARFDRLCPNHWCDLKTFDNSRGKRLEQAINDAVRFNRYYLTAASYFDAAESIRIGGLQIKGAATDSERALIAGMQIKPEHLDCWFIFQQKSGIPNLLARRFVFFDVPEAIKNSWDTGADDEAQARGHEVTRRPTQIYQKGRAEIDYAKRLFVLYSQVYRPGQPWAPLEQTGSITDLDFSPSWLEGRYE